MRLSSKRTCRIFIKGVNMAVLKTKNLKKIYKTSFGAIKALDNVNLEIEQREFVAITGTSGSGKSTLLHILGGLDKPSDGSVSIENTKIFELDDYDLTIFRRQKIGFIFQNYNLIPILNVYQNIILPVKLDGKNVDYEHVDNIIEFLKLNDKRDILPLKLSGGQQQRVAIARCLASKPAIILADEPTGNLDSQTGNDVFHLLKSMSKEFNQTVVMITHNETLAKKTDRCIRIEDGKILQ